MKNMEVKIKSKKLRGRFIYGDLLENKKTTTLAVLLSGLSGNDARPLTKNASTMLFRNGFSTLRVNFCNEDKPKNRKINALEIEQMSLAVYVAELKNIINSVGKKYSTIVLVGHSFGAPVLIAFLAKYPKYVSKIKLVLWDPSLLPWGKEMMDEVFAFDSIKKLYYQKGTRNSLIINKTFYKELAGTKNTAEILRGLNSRTCIITAEKGAKEDADKYFSKIRDKKSSTFSVIKGASHLFNGKRIQKELFEKTLGFLSTEDRPLQSDRCSQRSHLWRD